MPTKAEWTEIYLSHLATLRDENATDSDRANAFLAFVVMKDERALGPSATEKDLGTTQKEIDDLALKYPEAFKSAMQLLSENLV